MARARVLEWGAAKVSPCGLGCRWGKTAVEMAAPVLAIRVAASRPHPSPSLSRIPSQSRDGGWPRRPPSFLISGLDCGGHRVADDDQELAVAAADGQAV